MFKIAIITNVIPSYREGFYDTILNDSRLDVKIYCHKNIDSLNINSIALKYEPFVEFIEYKSIFNGKLLWQFLPYQQIYKEYDIVFVDGNVRHFSQAIFSTVLRFLKKKVVIWSTVHSHRNDGISKSIRLLWWKCFNNFMMYVERDIQQLKDIGFNGKNIISINNGLNQSKIDTIKLEWTFEQLKRWKEKNGLSDKKIILASSRVQKGKFDDLIHALVFLKKKHSNLICCIIGDGPYLNDLKQMAIDLRVNDIVRFEGGIYEESKLAPWFLSSYIMVHPAAIGLSIMHGFGYGLPIITHSDWKTHGPEFSIFEENITGFTYKKYNINDLASVINKSLIEDSVSNQMRQNCLNIVHEKYNTTKMAENFTNFCLTL